MRRGTFVTGAGGFIGKTLVERLTMTPGQHIKILTRTKTVQRLANRQIEEVVGDLLKPETYQAALEGCDTVVHLAAATGRVAAGECERVNVEGTRKLLQACKAAGVRRFLHVSTIAAGYSNQRYYPYAQTKTKAEAVVKESGLEFVIIRPTVVLGEKSPIWKTLSRIAGLSVIPMPQGRPVRVQPIHVDDVVRGIERLLVGDRFKGEVLELGGPRPMAFREFLELVQLALRGTPGRIINVPLAPIRFGLAMLEPALRPWMPATAGQLALFANDSVPSENWLLAELRDGMQSTQETIAELVNPAGRGGQTETSALPPVEGKPFPPESSQQALEKECRLFAAYLIGQTPSGYVVEQYARAARVHGLAQDKDFPCLDRATVKIARCGRVFARWIDAYCALFRRGGALRRKLVLLSAILEHVAPASDNFDRVPPSGAFQTILAVTGYGVKFVLSLLMGTLLMVPTILFCWIATHTASSNSQAR